MRNRAVAARLLSGAVLFAFAGFSTPAAAQEAETRATGDAQTVSEALTSDIVVNGKRQRTALDEERNAVATIDIVTTGDVAINSQTVSPTWQRRCRAYCRAAPGRRGPAPPTHPKPAGRCSAGTCLLLRSP